MTWLKGSVVGYKFKGEDIIVDADDDVADHFGIAPWTPKPGTRGPAHEYTPPPPELIKQLENYYEPHDVALAELLGIEPAWRRSPSAGQ